MSRYHIACFLESAELLPDVDSVLDADLLFYEMPIHEELRADVFVIDARCFVDFEQLLKAVRAISKPVLYLLPDQWLGLFIPFLRPNDELETCHAPSALLLHRLERMLNQPSVPRSFSSTELYQLDPLTGLLNRHALAARYKSMLDKLEPEEPLSLILADLDHFKAVNDTYGHSAGDEVIRETAARFQKLVPQRSLLARYGGEEFVFILPFSREVAVEFAERLRLASKEQLFLVSVDSGEVELEVTISFGVVTRNARKAILKELLGDASQAVYAAKAQGRDRVMELEQLELEAFDRNRSLELENFENMTRVLAERVGERIARSGRKMMHQIQEQADIDGLTGLYSRRYFDRRLRFDFEQAARKGSSFTVALMDADSFGQVNKLYGWPTGDLVLRELGERINGSLRAADWVARYGGEEICVVMLDTKVEQALIILERVRKAISSRMFFSTDQREFQVTMSIGASENQIDDAEPSELLERASEFLLLAKKDGKNTIFPKRNA